ncbi:MAG: PorV/PorQ family protein [Calditrichaeota bacterium]|nr:PorV/PorQ family protein [Calditrichota bacterium]
MKLKRNVSNCLVLSIFVFVGFAQAGNIVKAKYAGEFLASGVGGRALGMGGASVAIANDVTAGYWNPALLTQIDYPQIIGMHAQRFANIVNYNYGAVALPFGKTSTLALSVIRLGVDDIPNTTEALLDYGLDGKPNTGDEGEGNGVIDENERIDPYKVFYFNSAEWGMFLSYGARANRKISYGGSVKFLLKQLGEQSAWGVGFDVGMIYRFSDRFKLGANLQDATTTLLVWEKGRQEAIIPTLKLGSAYIWESSLIGGSLIPAFDVDVRFENRRYASQWNVGAVSFDSHAGFEYQFKKLIALRFGMDAGRFTAGIGIRLPKLMVDYAFLSHNDLGDTHRISVKLTIDEKRFQRRR